MKRQVALIALGKNTFGVRARERRLFWWGDWVKIVELDWTEGWQLEHARVLADAALENGWAPYRYDGYAMAILEAVETDD